MRFSPTPLAAARGATTLLGDGDRVGPFDVMALPGHAPDHLVFIADGVAFTGDAVLGEGSVFIAPDPGALRGYLAGLEGLREARRLRSLAPGHLDRWSHRPPSQAHPVHRAPPSASAGCAGGGSVLNGGARSTSTSAGARGPARRRCRCCAPLLRSPWPRTSTSSTRRGRLPARESERPAWPVAWLDHA